MSVPPPPRLRRRGSLVLTVLLVGCPLPFQFTGEGSGIPPGRERNGSTITSPVTFSYTEASGTTGVIADGGSYSAAVATRITLTTKTPDAVIYYTTDGSRISDLNAVDRFNDSSGSLAVAPGQKRVITAVAIGPHMRPSPITTVEINSGYRVIYHANLSPISGTLRGSGTPGGAALSTGSGTPSGAALSDGSRMPTDARQYVADTVTVQAPTVNGAALQRTTSGAYETPTGTEVQLIGGGTYVFDGWYTTDVGGTTTSSAVGATFAMPAKPVNLYAKWRQRYTVTFDRSNPCTTLPLTPVSGNTIPASLPKPSTPGNLPLNAPNSISYLHGSPPATFTAPDFPMTSAQYPRTSDNDKLISCGTGAKPNLEPTAGLAGGGRLRLYIVWVPALIRFSIPMRRYPLIGFS